MKPLPHDLPGAIHDVLRGWHHAKDVSPLWRDMLLVRQRLAEQPQPNLTLAVRGLLHDALERLDEQAGDQAARILRLRFLDGRAAVETANALNLTENVVYKEQRRALEMLAQLLWQREEAARVERQARINQRLELREPPRLFGVGEKLAELGALLRAEGPPWLVAVTGIGGIGKTSLADAAVRQIGGAPAFADVAWVSARREHFTLWDGLQAQPDGTPALTFEGLVDALAEQLEFGELTRTSPAEKQEGLHARLKARPYLVVVDNLETAADYRALVPRLQALANPGKFLLTSRRRLHEYPAVHNLDLDELSAADSQALVRHEAEGRGLADLAAAPDEALQRVYALTGGNPLALKLVVGLLSVLPLPRVLDDLRAARGRTVEELYRYIYWRAWQLLDESARQVLIVMPLVAESGGGLDHIASVSGVEGAALTDALRHLVRLSLVNVLGPVEERRYGIHRLTETFLLKEVLKWQANR